MNCVAVMMLSFCNLPAVTEGNLSAVRLQTGDHTTAFHPTRGNEAYLLRCILLLLSCFYIHKSNYVGCLMLKNLIEYVNRYNARKSINTLITYRAHAPQTMQKQYTKHASNRETSYTRTTHFTRAYICMRFNSWLKSNAPNNVCPLFTITTGNG